MRRKEGENERREGERKKRRKEVVLAFRVTMLLSFPCVCGEGACLCVCWCTRTCMWRPEVSLWYCFSGAEQTSCF